MIWAALKLGVSKAFVDYHQLCLTGMLFPLSRSTVVLSWLMLRAAPAKNCQATGHLRIRRNCLPCLLLLHLQLAEGARRYVTLTGQTTFDDSQICHGIST